MKLNLNKTKFVDNLLTPVSKLADNLLLDFVTSENSTIAKTIVSSADNSVILLGNVECQAIDPFRCVIPDCKTFLRLFSGIDKDSVCLEINSNAIAYKDSGLSFKYHLLDESYIVNKKSISEEKLNALSFDTTFQITRQKLSEIIKFNSIVPDAEKLYFTTEEGKVFAKLGDEQKSNTNEITTEVSNSFEGKEISETLPVNIQNILLFSFSTNEVTVKINHHLKVFKFESPNLAYVVSGLVR
jgi:hypothetical protein